MFSTRRSAVLFTSIVVVSIGVLAACSTEPVSPPTSAIARPTVPAPTPQVVPSKTAEPVKTSMIIPQPVPSVASKRIKIGLATDQGGVRDKAFNQAAWEGVQKAAKEFGFDTQVVEAANLTDLEANIAKLIADGCDVVVSVGYLMADATASKAIQHPQIRFVIIDVAYVPTKGASPCNESKKDCYFDGGLKNVTSLLFQEDEAGFLAGVVAGGMTKTGVVASVGAMEIPPVVKFVTGYQHGARFIKPDVKTLNVYLSHFDKPDLGRESANKLIDQQADVVFGLGGTTGNAALIMTKEKGAMAIGVDMDQYYTVPEAREALLTSAMKKVDVAVYSYLKTIKAGTAEAGVVTSNLKNGGVGIAPFHDWESRVPDPVKAKISEATEGLLSGKIVTGYKP